MNGALTFNANNLQDFNITTQVGIITNVINHTSIPEKIAELFTKADANGSVIPSINYPTKRISIGGIIKGSSQDNLDTRIDAFKAYFNGKDKNLDIDYAGSTRRYIATANSIGVSREQKALYATFTIEFICTNPFGLDISATSIINQAAYTSATFNATPTITGSAPYQLPIFTITINALTGTGDYIQISNDNNNQQIMLYGLGLAANDVVVIDCANRVVTVNDLPVDYFGTFLEVELGASSITYTDGFATRSVDIDGEYIKRYL